MFRQRLRLKMIGTMRISLLSGKSNSSSPFLGDAA